MLHLVPRQLPALSEILDDIGRPPVPALARALRVHERTVQRWIAADRAPRAVMLALWWLTRWGAAEIDAHAVNAARMYAGLVQSLKDDAARAEMRVQRLIAIADFGSANDPMMGHQAQVPPPAARLHPAVQPVADQRRLMTWRVKRALAETAGLKA